MNRLTRRRCARLARASARRRGHDQSTTAKQTHKLPAQACTVYFPDFGTYLVDMAGEPLQLKTVSEPTLATMLFGEDAEAVALAIAQATGMRATVRRHARQSTLP